MTEKKLTKYMQLKQEVKDRAPQLKKDTEAIRMLLRDKYGFGDRADEFDLVEEARRGYKGDSCHITKDRINLTIMLPIRVGTISDPRRPFHIIISSDGYFGVSFPGNRYKASALSPEGYVIACMNRCREFFEDIRKINPKYVGA